MDLRMAMGAVLLAVVGCGVDSAAVTRDAGAEAAHSGWGGPCALDPDSGAAMEPYCDLFGDDGRQMDCVEVSGALTCLPPCGVEALNKACDAGGGYCYGGQCLPGKDG